MLETRAKIVQVDGDKAWIEANPGLGCAQCAGKGCGSSKLGQLFCNSPRRFQAKNEINARVGDEVVVEVAEGVILRGVSLVYLLPLLSLFIGALLGSMGADSLAQQDGYAVVGAVLGLTIGVFLAKWISLRIASQQLQPRLARHYQAES